jgi:hypothetical protein
VTIIRAPREDQWAPGYYSLLFEDPDGIRLELNHVPGKGLLAWRTWDSSTSALRHRSFRFAEKCADCKGDRMTAVSLRLAAAHRLRHDPRNRNKGRESNAACREGGF